MISLGPYLGRLRRYWISWYTSDPLDPKSAPFRWWVSGEACTTPTLWTVVALVEAQDEKAAHTQVLTLWPDACAHKVSGYAFRFCNEIKDFQPGGRFP